MIGGADKLFNKAGVRIIEEDGGEKAYNLDEIIMKICGSSKVLAYRTKIKERFARPVPVDAKKKKIPNSKWWCNYKTAINTIALSRAKAAISFMNQLQLLPASSTGKDKKKRLSKNKNSSISDSSDEEEDNAKPIVKKTIKKKPVVSETSSDSSSSEASSSDNEEKVNKKPTKKTISKKKKPATVIDNEYGCSSSSDSDIEDTSVIDLYKNIYQYEGKLVQLVKIENNIWFKGSDVARILGYVKERDAIERHVVPSNKMTAEELKVSTARRETGRATLTFSKCDPNTNFINQKGLFSLVSHSKTLGAQLFMDWICDDLLPKLFSYGTYSMKPEKLAIKEFYDDNLLSDYKDKRVVYLAYVGRHNDEEILKFGISKDFPRRELKEHRKAFSTFKVQHIEICDSNQEVEEKLKIELDARKMLRKLKIEKTMQTELCALNAVNGIESVIGIIKRIAGNTKSDLERKNMDLQNKIRELKVMLKASNNLLKASNEKVGDQAEIISLLKRK
jgi:prophage antirepressor-like protein